MKIANHRIAICSVNTRPKRSANHPANHPPTADTSNAAVAQYACLRTRDSPNRDQRRDDEAVKLHVHGVESPSPDAGSESAALRSSEVGEEIHRVFLFGDANALHTRMSINHCIASDATAGGSCVSLRIRGK